MRVTLTETEANEARRAIAKRVKELEALVAPLRKTPEADTGSKLYADSIEDMIKASRSAFAKLGR